MGPEKGDALREDGAARGSDVSKRLCSIDTKAMDPSERPARRNLQKKKCNSQSAHLINGKGSVSRKKYVVEPFTIIFSLHFLSSIQTCYMEIQQMCGLSRGTGGVLQIGSPVKI